MQETFYRVAEFDGKGNIISKSALRYAHANALVLADLANHYKSYPGTHEMCKRFVVMDATDPIFDKVNKLTDEFR